MIMNFHFMQYFLLEHDGLVSGDCDTFFLVILNDYDRILGVLKFCGKIITSLP